MTVNVWAFTVVAVPFVATPGVSTAVVLRNSLSGGVRSGVATALGVNAGTIAYGVLAAFGVSIALQRWPAAWIAMRIAGVSYLAWLGLRSLVRACTPASPSVVSSRGAPAASIAAQRPLARDAREGFVTNVLNPSIATFYVLIVPQFIPADAPFAASALVLTAVHVTLAMTWHLSWAAAGGTLATLLGRTRPRQILEALTGVALLALAIRFLR